MIASPTCNSNVPRARARAATFAAFAIVVLLCSCARDARKSANDPDTLKAATDSQPTSDASAPTTEVTVALDTVRASIFVETLSNVGTVIARVGHVALLSAPGPTRVAQVLVSVGQRVRAGAELITFEQPAFDAALASAEAALTAADRTAARAQRLVDAGVAPRKDLDVALADLAVGRLNAVNARRAVELSHLRAPFSGAVTRVNTVLGASVDAGQPLVEIADPSALDVILFLSPSDVVRVALGNVVTLHDGANIDAPRVASGAITDIAASVDSATRGVAVRVAVSSPMRILRLGESLFGSIRVRAHAAALTVPDDALVPTGDGFRVFVVDSVSIAHARDVTVAGRANRRVWISEGLKAGEVVVATGAYGVDDGSRVVRAKP